MPDRSAMTTKVRDANPREVVADVTVLGRSGTVRYQKQDDGGPGTAGSVTVVDGDLVMDELREHGLDMDLFDELRWWADEARKAEAMDVDRMPTASLPLDGDPASRQLPSHGGPPTASLPFVIPVRDDEPSVDEVVITLRADPNISVMVTNGYTIAEIETLISDALKATGGREDDGIYRRRFPGERRDG